MTRTQAWLRYALLCALFYLIARSTVLRADEIAQETSHTAGYETAARSSMPLRWSGAVKIYQVYGERDISEHLRSAAWSWSERAGISLSYGGMTSSSVPGATFFIAVKVTTAAEVYAVSGSLTAEAATTTSYYMDTGEAVGAVVYLDERYLDISPDYAQYVINHEIGHAIGIRSHSSNRHDLMYASHVHSRYSPTAADGIAAGYSPQTCHAEIMDNGGVYIAGAGAYLRSVGGNVWRLEQYSPVSVSCANLERDGMDFTVRDLRGRSASYSWARMEWIGGDDWLLVGGE